jgi:AcrR family transcriptional regulator
MSEGGRLDGRALLDHPLTAATIAVVAERGYPGATLEEIAARAGVERAELEGQLATIDELAERILAALNDDFQARVGAAYRGGGRWPDSLRAAAYEAARWIRDKPQAAWFGMVGSLEAGDMARVRREENLRWGAALIDAGREVAPDPAAVPAAAPLLAVGAVAETLRRQQEGWLVAGVIESVPEMMAAAVRPYLGEAAARAELQIPAPSDLVG